MNLVEHAVRSERVLIYIRRGTLLKGGRASISNLSLELLLYSVVQQALQGRNSARGSRSMNHDDRGMKFTFYE